MSVPDMKRLFRMPAWLEIGVMSMNPGFHVEAFRTLLSNVFVLQTDRQRYAVPQGTYCVMI